MSRSTRPKLRSEISRGHSVDDADTGTAARIRPLSYDEIMLKRESKKNLEGFRDETGEAYSTRHVEAVKKPDHHFRDTHPSVMKNSRDYDREASSRKEERTSRRGDPHGKSKKKENPDVEGRSKHKHQEDVRYSTEASKTDSRGHRISKLDEHLREGTRYDYEKKNRRDIEVKDRYTARSRAESERENKRKDRNGDDERYRKRDPVKKHGSGNRGDPDISERKEKMEPSHSRHDDMRSKRKRSRSQEHTKDKSRRSSSSSPKARKNVSSNGHGHGELLQSQRDKTRHHSDIDQTKMSSNGSASHPHRHGGSASGLGGYSPRKRKTEAAVKTPPPPVRTPETKSAGWDLPPSGAYGNLSGSVASVPPLFSRTDSSNMIELTAARVSVASTMAKPLSGMLSYNPYLFKEASIDSVQLTQATRPLRRLYLDNVPGSASEKDIMDFFNKFMLSSGANHIQGKHPCISCMIHKEKRQALVEFLTPEDASAALSFDGRSLAGNILKVRRPKDFVEVASGVSERSKAGAIAVSNIMKADVISDVVKADAISDFVTNSSHKIFIGGIAEGLSSEMIKEIVSAFGPLKAYRFEINEDLNEPCAFLEYADHSITLEACAGLNGMKLGGRVLTVSQALPNAPSMDDYGSRPFYGVPEHVKPLLKMPTPVLKLSNVIDQKGMKLLSETDLEEIVEDVRLECSRFGSIISINIVKASNTNTAISEAREVTDDVKPFQPAEERDSPEQHLNKSVEGAKDHDDGDGSEAENVEELDKEDIEDGDKRGLAPTNTVEEVKEAKEIGPQNCDDEAANDLQELAVIDLTTIERTGEMNGSDANHQEVPVEDSGVEREVDPRENLGIENLGNGEILSDKTNLEPQEVERASNDGSGANPRATENAFDTPDMLEVGCVLVEFRRTEASSEAAHCLHGRVFDDHVVTVEYVPLDAYRARFPK